MAITGIGTDIVSVARIRRVHERHPQQFAKKILSPSELETFSSHTNPAVFLAKRFAVKEATSKALGTGMRNGVCFTDISVSHSPLGQPQLHCTGSAQAIMDSIGVCNAHLSLSDEIEYVVAFVVLER
jgi:holo-[acyl-carrier protein] synthase